jgi:sulfur-oxidizing protein SoxY
MSQPTRRDTLIGLAAATGTLAVLPVPAMASTDLAGTIAAITKGAAVNSGRVKLTMPELAENGSTVSTVIDIQSPMTAADHVKSVTVMAEKNPQTILVRFHLGPRAGRARVATNVRLAETQTVVALAEMSDGTFWRGNAEVIVTLAACIDGG